MSNLNTALRIGTSGLQISQLALATVSHNVVNANTVGYSRQVVQTSSSAASGYGNGVKLENIQRITDRFIVERQLTASADTAYSSVRRSYLDNIESFFTSSGGGLNDTVSEFMNSLSQLSNDPSNTALRRNTVQLANLVAQNLQSTNNSLESTATSADLAVSNELILVNQLVRDISELNAQITAVSLGSSNGENANDLADVRDAKISELGKIFSVQVNVNATTGAVRVTTENGRKLVDDTSYVQLTRSGTAGSYVGIGLQNVKVDGTLSATVFPLDTDTLTGGRLKAIIDIRDDVVPDLTAQLDEFASTFITEFNKIASRGSSFPPVNSLTSASTTGLASTATNLYTGLNAGLESSTFNISVVDSQGDPINTTVGGTVITFPTPGPFTLDDLAALINNNVSIGNTALGGTLGVTATATTDSNGDPIITIAAANSSHRIVLSNGTGDPLGILGMNTLFSGTNSNDIAVKPSILAAPDLIPIGRMRSTDGGLSSQDNQNILALSQLADATLSFDAAGSLGAQTVTAAGYTAQILSNLAVTVAEAGDREQFNESISTQLDQLSSSVSGVNINEELSQMLVFQNSFQASARIITVVSELLDELVNIIR